MRAAIIPANTTSLNRHRRVIRFRVDADFRGDLASDFGIASPRGITRGMSSLVRSRSAFFPRVSSADYGPTSSRNYEPAKYS